MKCVRAVVCGMAIALLAGCGGGGGSTGASGGGDGTWDPWPLASTWSGSIEFRPQSGSIDIGDVVIVCLSDNTFAASITSHSSGATFKVAGNWAKTATFTAKFIGTITAMDKSTDSITGDAWGQDGVPNEMRFQWNVERNGSFIGAWVGKATRP